MLFYIGQKNYGDEIKGFEKHARGLRWIICNGSDMGSNRYSLNVEWFDEVYASENCDFYCFNVLCPFKDQLFGMVSVWSWLSKTCKCKSV